MWVRVENQHLEFSQPVGLRFFTIALRLLAPPPDSVTIMTVELITAGPPQDVQIPTIDGVILAGRLFPAGQQGPAVLLMPGVRDQYMSHAVIH